MKYLLIMLALIITGSCIGQTDEKALEKAKDYINYRMTWWVLVERNKENAKAVTKEQLNAVTHDLENVIIDDVPGFSTLSKLLTEKFPTALQNIAGPIDSIDIHPFASHKPEVAAKQL